MNIKKSVKKSTFINSSRVTLSEWLAHTPYGNGLPNYDVQFLPLCNDVLNILNKNKHHLIKMGCDTLEERKTLAVTLVAFFEDFINDIGIWKVYIETNKALFGFYLPFYDLSEYDTEYLNTEDFTYLIYHFCMLSEKEDILNPMGSIWDIGYEIFTYLEEKVETINPTNFYDKYLKISGKDNYFEVKEKIVWFGQQSYLVSLETLPLFEDTTEQYAELAERNPSAIPAISKFLYQEIDNICFSFYSSFAGLSVLDWLAKIAKADESTKNDIKNLAWRHGGAYWYEKDYDKSHFLFVNAETSREYNVLKDSIQKSEKFQKGENVNQSKLIKWNNSWWHSGTMVSTPKSEYTNPMYSIFDFPWTKQDDAIAKSRELLQEDYDSFVAFFKAPYVIGETAKEMNDKLFAWVSKKVKAANPNIKQSSLDNMAKMMFAQNDKLTREFGKNGRITTFYIEGFGQVIEPKFDSILTSLKAKNIPDAEKKNVFYILAKFLNPKVSEYLVKTYPTKNILFPFAKNSEESLSLLPYFYRFFNAKELDLSVPIQHFVDDAEKYKHHFEKKSVKE